MPKGGLVAAIEEALIAGVRAVQLREKDISVKDLTELAIKLRVLTSKYGAKFLINDRLDVALSVGADGVHLGQSSFTADVVRRVVGDRPFIIGVSTHGVDEAMKAQDKGADFITIGPVYETASKLQYGVPVGVTIIEEVKEWVQIPCFAIGGIKTDNVKEVLDYGADGVALISAILAADDVRRESEKFMELLK